MSSTSRTVSSSDIMLSKVNGTIGAEVSNIDLASDLPGRIIECLNTALVEHRVLFFRDQDLDTARLISLGRRFGPLEVHPFDIHLKQSISSSDSAIPEVVVVESKPGAAAAASTWHSDMTWRRTPPLGSILRCTHAPSYGGETLWADMAAAYEGLDDATQASLSGMVAVHDWHPHRQRLQMEGVDARLIEQLKAQFPPVEHPVVRTHPVSGEKLIYVNPAFTVCIKGMSRDESDALLATLYQLPYKPEYQVRFRWSVNSVAFWDNRGTQHYAVGDFGGQHRRLERVTIGGDMPF